MGRTAGYSKKNYNYTMDPYIEGNVVRKPVRSGAAPQRRTQAAPQRRTQTAPQRRTQTTPQRRTYQTQEVRPLSQKEQSRRARVQGINFAYVVFLFAAAALSLFICIQFLQLRMASMTHAKTIDTLESQILDLKTENDIAYDNVMASVNLEEVKDIAINRLGMVYADQGQIITYDSQDGDYVRQYEDVPTE